MIVMTVGAWLVAFVVVLTLLTLLGDELKSLPLALRALLISGVLVTLMANVVMPLLSVVIARWLSGVPTADVPREHASAGVDARASHDRERQGTARPPNAERAPFPSARDGMREASSRATPGAAATRC